MTREGHKHRRYVTPEPLCIGTSLTPVRRDGLLPLAPEALPIRVRNLECQAFNSVTSGDAKLPASRTRDVCAHTPVRRPSCSHAVLACPKGDLTRQALGRFEPQFPWPSLAPDAHAQVAHRFRRVHDEELSRIGSSHLNLCANDDVAVLAGSNQCRAGRGNRKLFIGVSSKPDFDPFGAGEPSAGVWPTTREPGCAFASNSSRDGRNRTEFRTRLASATVRPSTSGTVTVLGEALGYRSVGAR